VAWTGATSLERVRAAAARVAESYGLQVFDLQFRREPIGWVLRVVLDREPAATHTSDAPGTPAAVVPSGEADVTEVPVTIDDCQRVSQDLSALLDVDDEFGAALDTKYTLEVSSPGLDRPLRTEADFRRFRGRLAKIVTTEPVQGQTSFDGRLEGVERGLVLVAEGRRTHQVPLSLVKRAHLEVEF